MAKVTKKKTSVLPPTDLDQLRELRQSLKDKEARLEADLAIIDSPELEREITQVILAIVRVRVSRAAVEKDATEDNKQAIDEIARRQAAAEYEILKAEAALARLTNSKTYLKKSVDRFIAEMAFTDVFEKAAATTRAAGFDLRELIPSIDDL